MYHLVTAAAVCMTIFFIGGCTEGNRPDEDELSQSQSVPIDTGSGMQGDIENIVQGEGIQGDTVDSAQDGTEDRSQVSGNVSGELTDAELEEELARYRQEREDNIQEAGGLVEGGSPDESNYTFDLSGIGLSQFDTRETTEGFAAARIYVTDILGIQPNTKMEVYMCVDPRILKIYEDEDKGVASGYDNNNIFVCEYCGEDSVWQYLILVRDGKGSRWEVIHNGNSYTE